MTNEQWLREQARNMVSIIDSLRTLDALETRECVDRYQAIADELAAKDRELAELRALVDSEIQRLDYLLSINNDRGTSEASWLDRARALRSGKP